MTKIVTKKCPDCGGELVKSGSYRSGYSHYFWSKPKPWSKFIENEISVYPWACMNCGRVFFYLNEKEYEKIKQEYEKRKMTGEL